MEKQRLTAEELSRYEKETLIQVILFQYAAIEQLQEQVAKLNARVEELERTTQRQAAPFRRREKLLKAQEDKKNPGREKGHPGSFRSQPSEVDFDEEVKLEACPFCGGEVEELEMVEQYVEEIPRLRPLCWRIRTWRGRCCCCKREVCSRHPMQVSEASGKAGVHLGVNAQRWCLALQYDYGLSRRKSCRLLQNLTGLRITPGGLVHLAHRNAGKLQGDYEGYLEELRNSPSVHSDETSWYAGSPRSWLWVLANTTTTCYRVDERRSRQVIQQMLGENYNGTLTSDCLVVYEGVCSSQQKCYAHHCKAIKKAIQERREEASKKGEAESDCLAFLEKLNALLKTAQHVKEQWRQQQIPAKVYWQRCLELEDQADELLLPQRENDIEEKVANRLRKQRKYLFTFLYRENVDATNNLAERQLRPAVIARKVSCGNRTRKGADTWQTLASVFTTANQRNEIFLDLLSNRIHLSLPQPLWAVGR